VFVIEQTTHNVQQLSFLVRTRCIQTLLAAEGAAFKKKGSGAQWYDGDESAPNPFDTLGWHSYVGVVLSNKRK